MKLPLQKFNIFLLIFTTLIILSNCAYEFSEDSFIEISQKTPTASISLNDLSDNQTFYVPTKIIFNYNGNNKHLLYEIKIHIDNVKIKSSTINSGDFNINTESLEDGNHILKVEYIFSSGSGSLADVSGVEAYIKTEEYNFTVDKSLPETVTLKTAEIIDGSIYLSWEPISKLNFDSAMLIITNNGNKSYYEMTKQELLNLSYNDTFVHTSTCQGQTKIDNDLEYQIFLKNTRGNTASNTKGLYIKPFEIEKLILNENQYKLIIPEHTLYKNFDYYLFTDSNSNTFKVNSLGGEIIVKESIKFPSYNSGVVLNFYKKSSAQDNYKGCSFLPTSYDKQFQSDYGTGGYNKFVYNESDGYIYTLRVYSACPSCENSITIEQRNSNDLTVINSKLIARVDDYDDEELTIDPTTGNLIVDAGSISFLLDKNSLSIINQWSRLNFGEQSGNIFYRNNIIVIEQNDKVSFYDSNTKSQFYTLNKTGYFKISSSAKYFYVNDSIFEITNNSVNLVSTTDTNNSVNLVEFIEVENKCVYNSYDGNPIVFDLMTRTKSTLSDFTRINIMDYDNGTNKLLFIRSEFGLSNTQLSYAYVYDFTTTNFKKIKVENVVSIWRPNDTPRGYWFAKDKLISSYGYYLNHYINE